MLLGWVGFSQRCSLACLNLLNDMMSLTSEELSRSDLSFGFDIFFSSDTWQVFPRWKSQHCLGWLVRDTFLEQNCLVIVIEKALPWMVSYSAKSSQIYELKMIFVPTFPFGWGDFSNKKNPWTFLQMSIPWKDFPPKKFVGCQVPTLPFPNKNPPGLLHAWRLRWPQTLDPLRHRRQRHHPCRPRRRRCRKRSHKAAQLDLKWKVPPRYGKY